MKAVRLIVALASLVMLLALAHSEGRQSGIRDMAEWCGTVARGRMVQSVSYGSQR